MVILYFLFILYWVYLGKPKGHPNVKMISEPIWTTWAKYKKDISDKTVLEFGKDIRNHGYKGGQLEIDDNWEVSVLIVLPYKII